jgi:hypothetical protein
VIVVTKETSHARKLHAFVQSSIPQCAEHVRMLPSGEFFSFFETLVGTMNPKEETVRGTRVKLHQVATSDADARSRKEAIATVIAKSFRKMEALR